MIVCTRVPYTLDEILAENEGELILAGGPLSIADVLHDEMYRVSVRAVKLKKTVEVYQWKETEHTKKRTVRNADGEEVTHIDKSYTYHKDWFEHHIDSSRFHNSFGHENPYKEHWPAESRIETSRDARIGKFLLGPELTDRMTNWHRLPKEELPTSAWAWVNLHNGKDLSV